MRIVVLMLTGLILCVGCTSVKKIADNEYRIRVKGSPFDNLDSLKNKVRGKAVTICAPNEYKIVKNWFGDDFAFEQEHHYTMASDIVSGIAIAKIRCIVDKTQAQKQSKKADKSA
ncbi:hypothetical protein [uncultured Shewanella sp.]|uniref:hypothetical protein n=1 Tax=uncultured Shewanella sp. TaxID=173975 RepID=UPI0026381138|nr:hypothetical protein [uncultured Shewanella sp.]